MGNKALRTWDAPVWAGIVVLVFAVGALGCIGIAAAEATQPVSADIVSVSSSQSPR
jgi:hypothetical protein